MNHSLRYRVVLSVLVIGAVIAGAVFAAALAMAVYLSISAGSAVLVLVFFMSGLPLLAGASAVFLGYSVRSHAQHGGSRGTALMAGYALVLVFVVLFLTIQAFYGSAS